MKLQRFISGEEPLFERAMALYEEGFPRVERRDLPDQMEKLKDKDFYCCAMTEESGEFVGILYFWESDSFVYLEHLCIDKGLRGKGFGSAALELLLKRGKTVILEIEPVLDDVTANRKRFYENNGFFYNSHSHFQPKYRKEDEDLALWIMSYGREISKEEYDEFNSFLKERVQTVGV